MKPHPLSESFAEMDSTEYQALKHSIKENGLQEPITTFQGMILDGRHRLKACIELGIKPKFKEFQRNGINEEDFVVIQNINRRNLTPSQKACASVYWMENKRNGIKKMPNGSGKLVNQAISLFGVSHGTILYGVYVFKRDKKLFEKCKNGKIEVQTAYLKLARDKASPCLLRKKQLSDKWIQENNVMRILDKKLAEGWEVQIETHKGKWFCHFHGRNGILRMPTLALGEAYEKFTEALKDKIERL